MRPTHGLCPQRLRPSVPSRGGRNTPQRPADLILAVLGVALLGGFALAAACALATGA